jgi:lipopolysaccharide transport system ATP-binding protein
VDEVLAVGDVAFQKKCLGKMQDVSRGGRTVIFISHNMAAIAALCNRALVLDRGRTVFDGSAADGVRCYLERNLADSAASWPLTERAPSVADLGSLIRLERVSANMARDEGFAFGEPLRFSIELHARGAADGVACAIGLDTLYGSRVVTFISDARPLSAVAGARYRFDVTIPPFGLMPGKYLLSVSVYSGGRYHDLVVHFGAMTVLPVDAGTREHVEEPGDRGAISVPSVWRVSDLTTVRAAS